MGGVHKFYPTWRFGVKAGLTSALGIIVLGLASAVVLPQVLGTQSAVDPAVALQRIASLAPGVVFALVAAFIIVGRLCPFKATADGVLGSGVWGATRFVRWQDIDRVLPYAVYGMQLLKLESSVAKTVTVFMLADERSEASKFVELHAGARHPLAQWLRSAGGGAD